MTDSNEIKLAVREFCAAAIEKGDFASPASHDRKLHAAMSRAVQKLHSLGASGAEALRALLQHESPHVRSWVAAELLAAGDKTAKPVLEALASNPGLLGTSANTVLREYEKGRLRSPFGA